MEEIEIVENDAEKYNAILAVHQALMHKPSEFKDTVHHLLADRLEKAVENKREEIAQSIFNGELPETQVDDSATEEGAEETTVESEPEVDEVEDQSTTEEEETIEEVPTEE